MCKKFLLRRHQYVRPQRRQELRSTTLGSDFSRVSFTKKATTNWLTGFQLKCVENLKTFQFPGVKFENPIFLHFSKTVNTSWLQKQLVSQFLDFNATNQCPNFILNHYTHHLKCEGHLRPPPRRLRCYAWKLWHFPVVKSFKKSKNPSISVMVTTSTFVYDSGQQAWRKVNPAEYERTVRRWTQPAPHGGSGRGGQRSVLWW